jgi:hypothetical protein
MADIIHQGLTFIDRDPIWIFHEEKENYQCTIQLIKFQHDYICDLKLSDIDQNIYHYHNANIRPKEKVLKELHLYYTRLLRHISEHYNES